MARRIENLVIAVLLMLMTWGAINSTTNTKLIVDALERSSDLLITAEVNADGH